MSLFKYIVIHMHKYNKIRILRCVGSKFCVKFQMYPYITDHTSQHMHVARYNKCRLMISWSYDILRVSETGSRPGEISWHIRCYGVIDFVHTTSSRKHLTDPT